MKLNEPQIHSSLVESATNGGSTVDGRLHIRYPLRAPVAFKWADMKGAQREAKGNSRDISEGGAFIVSRTCPQIGAGIILTFRLSFPPNPGRPRAIEMTGRVGRIELLLDNKGSWGFAVTSTQVILLEDEEV
jgi:hypothetical protein